MLVVSPYITHGLDADSVTYINAVESADGQTLEWSSRIAFDKFIKGCKFDGIWDAIKASCILAGARTLDGALTPLKGPAPTNYNFVSGDYNRKTGLKGDASTKYLDTNRNNNADPQNDNHNAVWMTQQAGNVLMGSPLDAGANQIFNTLFRNRSLSYVGGSPGVGLQGTSRSNSATFDYSNNNSITTANIASDGIASGSIHLFQRNAPDSYLPSNARLSFYSIGTNLDLGLLRNRVSQLMTDINNAF